MLRHGVVSMSSPPSVTVGSRPPPAFLLLDATEVVLRGGQEKNEGFCGGSIHCRFYVFGMISLLSVAVYEPRTLLKRVTGSKTTLDLSQ